MLSDERQLKAMRLLQEDPEISQRQLATAMGISVGATNYCLRALVDKGWVKLENFQKNPNKLGYLYLLTPTGVNAKAALTAEFLKRKLVEYEKLSDEIESLRHEVGHSCPCHGISGFYWISPLTPFIRAGFFGYRVRRIY